MVLDLGVPVTLEKKKEKKCGSQNGGAAGVGSVVIFYFVDLCSGYLGGFGLWKSINLYI